mgnify:CR=1 FL=1
MLKSCGARYFLTDNKLRKRTAAAAFHEMTARRQLQNAVAEANDANLDDANEDKMHQSVCN